MANPSSKPRDPLYWLGFAAAFAVSVGLLLWLLFG